jgi:hypothetical protein
MASPVAPGPGRLYRKLAADVATLGLPASPPALAVVTEADLAALPDAAVRYLNFMGVAGREPPGHRPGLHRRARCAGELQHRRPLV